MVFSRVPAEGFDDFMGDPELVLAVVEDMGFDQEDLAANATNADPMALYQMMEGRWSGEERNFSFEKSWPFLKQKSDDIDLLNLIENGGRNSKIYNEAGPIRVLSIDQVTRASEGVEKLAIEVIDQSSSSDEEFALNDLLPGLKRFFEIANTEGEYVLISLM